jgi:hypothetical protein
LFGGPFVPYLKLFFSTGMIMKKYLIVFLFAIMAAGALSAQVKEAYIKPTYSVGFAASDIFSGPAMSLDIDFVNSFGLTIGLQDLVTWESDYGIVNSVGFGLGYTYDVNKWSIGGKLMTVPLEIAQDGGIGFNITGTYWFRENLGITGITDINFLFESDITVFSMRVGISFKY